MLAGVMAYSAFLVVEGSIPFMDWVSGDVLSIGGLVSLIVIGLSTSRLYTKSQVDKMLERHDAETKRMEADHTREMTNMRDRYEEHLTRTVGYYQSAVDTAVKREDDWREVANDWQKVAHMLSEGFEPLHEQSGTILNIIREMQLRSRPPSGRSR